MELNENLKINQLKMKRNLREKRKINDKFKALILFAGKNQSGEALS